MGLFCPLPGVLLRRMIVPIIPAIGRANRQHMIVHRHLDMRASHVPLALTGLWRPFGSLFDMQPDFLAVSPLTNQLSSSTRKHLTLDRLANV